MLFLVNLTSVTGLQKGEKKMTLLCDKILLLVPYDKNEKSELAA